MKQDIADKTSKRTEYIIVAPSDTQAAAKHSLTFEVEVVRRTLRVDQLCNTQRILYLARTPLRIQSEPFIGRLRVVGSERGSSLAMDA